MKEDKTTGVLSHPEIQSQTNTTKDRSRFCSNRKECRRVKFAWQKAEKRKLTQFRKELGEEGR